MMIFLVGNFKFRLWATICYEDTTLQILYLDLILTY